MPEIYRHHPDKHGYNYSGDPTKPPHLFPQQTSKAEVELRAMHDYYKKRVVTFLLGGIGVGFLVGYISGLLVAGLMW